MMKYGLISSPIDSILAIADDEYLHHLSFCEKTFSERNLSPFEKKFSQKILKGDNIILNSIAEELKKYFSGTLKKFTTPIHLNGTPFQLRAWHALSTIPYGETRSYAAQAALCGNQKAFRAVGSANGANQLAIIIPCHRVINANGNLGGYAGGLDRKQFLLNLEKRGL